MNPSVVAVLLVLTTIACVNSESQGISVAEPTRIGSVYLVPIFLPNQPESEPVSNGIAAENQEVSPLRRIVLGYSVKENKFDNAASDQESVNSRQKRSPGGGRGHGGGGGGGRGSSGSWSQSSSSSSSGSWGGGSGGGRGSGKGKGYGR